MSRVARRAAAALLALLPLAACGIQESDVVEAGGAATVIVRPVGGTSMVLFYVGPDGRLMLVARDIGFRVPVGAENGNGSGTGEGTDQLFRSDYRIATDKVLTSLLEGPNEEERAAGLTTKLPPLHSLRPHSLPRPDADGTTVLHVRVAIPVHDIAPLALRQLVCTAAYAEADKETAPPVVVSGPDGALPATRCEVD